MIQEEIIQQYTPGPWTVPLDVRTPECIPIYSSKTGFHIDGSLADLNLMAAAPDLLEACKSFLDSSKTTLQRIDLAKLAISKAEGKL